MSLDIAFNPPQFFDEYDGVKMRMLVEEIERLHAVLTADTDDEGVASTVDSFNTRVGDIIPIQADYDSFFLTPAEGDAAYAAIGNVVNSFEGRQGTVVATVGDYADVAETFTVLQTFNADITFPQLSAINFEDGTDTPREMIVFEEGGAGGVDPYAANVVLQLGFEGTDGQTSTTDTSTGGAGSPHTISFFNSAEIDTALFKEGASSLLSANALDYVSAPSHADFAYGTNDFTIEMYVYVSGASGGPRLFFDQRAVGVTTSDHVSIFHTVGAVSVFVAGSIRITGGNLTNNGWTHVCVEELSGTLHLYLDGVWQAGWVNTTNYIAGAPTFGVASDGPTSIPNGFIGSIDMVRITNGVARYAVGTGNFTPPTQFGASGTDAFVLGHHAFDIHIHGADILIDGPASVDSTLDVTSALTAASYGGILEANLVDKTAAETMSAVWTWNGAGIRADVLRATDDIGLLQLHGGLTSGASIDLYGGTHASTPNAAIYDALTHTFRDVDGAPTYMLIDSTGITVTGDISGTTLGGIAEANLLDLTVNETITGQYTFAGNPFIINTAPRFTFRETDAAVDNGHWRLYANSEQFSIDALNDAESVSGNAILINRTGTVIDNISLNGTINITGANLNLGDTNFTMGGNQVFSEDGTYLRLDDSDSWAGGLLIGGDVQHTGATNLIGATNSQTGFANLGGSAFSLYDSLNTTFSTLANTATGLNWTAGGVGTQLLNITGYNAATLSVAGHITLVSTAGDVQLTNGTDLLAYDATNTDYISVRDTGAEAQIYSNINPVKIYGNFDTHGVSSAFFNGASAIFTNVFATTYDGITAANLLDKSAAETVSGSYTFTPQVVLNGGFDSNAGSSIDGGGQVFSLLPGAADHVYMGFHARTASPGTRSAYIGFGGAAGVNLELVNEIGGNVNITGNIINLTGAVASTSTIAATGAVTGSNLSGTNTGDQTDFITGTTFSGQYPFVFDTGLGVLYSHTDMKFTGATGQIDLTGSLIATGAVTGSNLNVSNWDTAFSWGDHAGVYLPLGGGTMTGVITGFAANEGSLATSGATTIVRAQGYSTMGSTYSAASTFLANNAYVDNADVVSGQMRYALTHATYGHTIYEQAAGIHTWYGESASVTLDTIITKVQQMQLSASGELSVLGGIDAGGQIDSPTFGSASGDLVLEPFSGLAYVFNTGIDGTFRVYDSGGTAYLSMTHDSTIASLLANIGDINISPAAGTDTIFMNGKAEWKVINNFDVDPTGMVMALYTATEGYIQIPGVTGSVSIWNGATARIANFDDNGTTTLYGPTHIRDGQSLQIFDPTDTDSASFTHDGVDFNTAFITTTDWNITGITAIQAGTVDADFDAITATSYGGIAEADLVSKNAVESIAALWTFVADMKNDGGHYLSLERGAAAADEAGYGQIWVKTATPNQLWFTPDDGNDVRIDPSMSEIVGKVANYTLLYEDRGKTIRFTGSTAAQTITIPANASVAFPVGTMIGFENDGTVSISIAITTDTLTWSKDNTTGTRTLAAGASAVAKKTTATTWKIAGSALVT